MTRTLILCLPITVAGCAVGPRYVPPQPIVPAAVVAANAPRVATPLSAVTEEAVDLTDWWSQFGDKTLDDLIRRARAGNLDRQTAASRVREARAAADQARAALLPSVQSNAGYYHARLSENVVPSELSSGRSGGSSGGGQSTGGGSGGSGSGGSGAIETDVFLLGLQGSYTLDLFGANRSAARAARERAEAETWSEHDTEVTVASETAKAYFALRTAQMRLAVLAANARSQSDLLAILVARARGGLVNEIDAARQRSQLSLIQAQTPPVEAISAAYVHQIELLLGLGSGELAATLTPAAGTAVSLPRIPPRVPVGLPSAILERRPDIRQAERTLAASVSDVDQATARLYPQIQLTGLASLVSSSLSSLVEWSSRSILGGASLLQPLFDGGGRQAQKLQSEERSIQAEIAYRRTVLTAFSQTADALARYGSAQRQLAVLQSGYADARRAATLNRAQYAGGLSDLTGTLQTESTALQTQDQLVQAQGQVFADLVDLYRSLGGGWNPREGAVGPQPHPEPSTVGTLQ